MVDEESMPRSGVLMSPNYPERYPNNHDSTQTIQVAEGKTIKFLFTNFNTKRDNDYVQLVGKDGIDLFDHLLSGKMDLTHWQRNVLASGGFNSNSSIVHVKFHTDEDGDGGWRSGWRMEWTESE